MQLFSGSSWRNLGRKWWPGFAILVIYVISHVWNLAPTPATPNGLPVFADEAIYIRWAQLIVEEPSRYLFFALNDGKTPLFIWFLAPLQALPWDHVLTARWLAVLVGLIQVLVVARILHKVGARRSTLFIGMALTTILPFWFLHHRLALMDGLLTLWLSLCLMGLLELIQQAETKPALSRLLERRWLIPTGLTGLALGMAFWTKIPAVLAWPMFVGALLVPTSAYRKRVPLLVALVGSGVLGLGLFVSLRVLTPAFGQLFARGGDFLYPLAEFGGGVWKQTLPNTPTYIQYFWQYLTWPVFVLSLAGLFSQKYRRYHHWWFWSAIGFGIPIVLLGKVVYPRYFLPMTLYFTLSTALMLETVIQKVTSHASFIRNLLWGSLIAFLSSQIVIQSSLFILTAGLQPAAMPLVPADQTQYLNEWSAGYGTWETAQLLTQRTQHQRVAVATEGFFGSLPDGLLLYFFGQPVPNLLIEGIGQPVGGIPESFWDKTAGFDQVLLVVNSHRLKMPLPADALVTQFCRPAPTAPCLQVWDITQYQSEHLP